jgi:hypothetical protein
MERSTDYADFFWFHYGLDIDADGSGKLANAHFGDGTDSAETQGW